MNVCLKLCWFCFKIDAAVNCFDAIVRLFGYWSRYVALFEVRCCHHERGEERDRGRRQQRISEKKSHKNVYFFSRSEGLPLLTRKVFAYIF